MNKAVCLRQMSANNKRAPGKLSSAMASRLYKLRYHYQHQQEYLCVDSVLLQEPWSLMIGWLGAEHAHFCSLQSVQSE